MSDANLLRRAADAIYHDLAFGQEYGDEKFLAAVADWLNAEAAKQTPTSHLAVTFDGAPMFPVDPRALATARAYLAAA